MERIKCFICASWTQLQWCVREEFYGDSEWVCPACYQKLLEKDNMDKESFKLTEGVNAKRANDPN